MPDPIDPNSLTKMCRNTAAMYGVDPVEYRRWERGEKVPEVAEAVRRYLDKKQAH
jgi:hypothetical protein